MSAEPVGPAEPGAFAEPGKSAPGTATEISPLEPATPGGQEQKKRILVVEDEGLIAADVQGRLEKLGYSVPKIASSGAEALECARSIPLDLVLMDIRLRGDIDGIATAQALRSELHVPVVYMTAHSDAETVHRAMATEPLGYMLKPIANNLLRDAVQAALSQQELKHRRRTDEAWRSPAHASPEINFLKYRLEVVNSWPESDYKQTALKSILARLDSAVARSADAVDEPLPEPRAQTL